MENETKVTVTFGQVSTAPNVNAWGELCEKYNVPYWCVSDGAAKRGDTIEISLEDALRWGFDCSLIHRINVISKIDAMLATNRDFMLGVTNDIARREMLAVIKALENLKDEIVEN